MVLSRHGTRSFPSSASSTPKGFSEPNLTANLWGLARRPQDAPCFFPKAASLMHYIGFFPSHMECVKCLNSSSLIEMERWQPTVSCWRLAEGKKKNDQALSRYDCERCWCQDRDLSPHHTRNQYVCFTPERRLPWK